MEKENVTPALVNYIESEIIPRYEAFDKAHNLNHVQTVINESLSLAGYYPVRSDMVYAIAAYHDTGLVEGREFHHLVSGKIIEADSLLRTWFSEEDIKLMKEAVEDHRASAKQEPRSIYGKIVAEADRIIDPVVTLRRTVQYGLKHNPDENKDWQYTRFKKHLTEKYAEGGYLTLWIPFSGNAERLERLREIIKNEKELKSAFEGLYNDEMRIL